MIDGSQGLQLASRRSEKGVTFLLIFAHKTMIKIFAAGSSEVFSWCHLLNPIQQRPRGPYLRLWHLEAADWGHVDGRHLQIAAIV